MNRKCQIPVIRIDDWPAADREAWCAAISDGDILDDAGPLANYSRARLKLLRDAYGRWLGFLLDDLSGGVCGSGSDYIDRERVGRYVEALQGDLAPISVAYYVEHLGYAVRALAPDQNVKFIIAAGRRMRKAARPTRDKRTRLRPTYELYELGLALMREAESISGPVNRAILFRDGLMIAFLAARPVRVGNLAQIEIDRHLVKRGNEYWLEFAPEEVKNRRPIEIPFPEDLVEPLHRYIEAFRPILAGRSKQANDINRSLLWLSRNGTGVSNRRIWAMIGNHTERRFGQRMYPHLFRDAAATSIAIEDPAHVRMITQILGHASPSMAERHYNQATSLEAARRMQAGVQSRRAES